MRSHAARAACGHVLVLILALLPWPAHGQGAPPAPAAPSPAAGSPAPAGFAVPFSDGQVVITRAPHPALSAASAANPDAACSDTPPVPLEPAGGATASTLTPVFRWSKAADLYTTRIQIATDSRFTRLVYDVVWLNLPAGESAGPLVWDDLAPDTTYYWRLSDACADFFAPSRYSATATFRTPNPPPPAIAAPDLLGPPDGGVMPALRSFSAWRNAPDTYGYQVRLYLSAEDAAADRWEELYWSTSGFLPYAYWRGPRVWYASEPQRELYWRARLHDGRRWGPYSPLRRVQLFDSDGFTGLSDLRVVPDGYQFPNFAASPAALSLRDLFGDDAVCSTPGPACRVLPRAERWAAVFGLHLAQGSAAGMAATALRFGRWRYAFLANEACPPAACDSPLAFDEDALSAFALDRADVERHIAAFQARQFTLAAATERTAALNATPGDVLEALDAQLRQPAGLVLLLQRPDGRAAHALIPTILEQATDDVARVWVYDPNRPADPGRVVEIDPARGVWRYDLGGDLGAWAGDASVGTLGVYSPTVSGATGDLACPWCAGAAMATIVYDGPGSIVIADTEGRRLGDLPPGAGGGIVSEIPGGVRDLPPGGLGAETPIYYVPADTHYTVQVTPNPDAAPDAGALHVFGPGYALRVDADRAWPLVLLNDGSTSVTLFGRDTGSLVSVEYARAGDGGDYMLAVIGFPLEAGANVDIVVAEAAGELIVSPYQNPAASYNMLYLPAGDTGRAFAANGIFIEQEEIHRLHWGEWDGTGPLTLTAQTMFAGETRLLANEFIPRVHAPLIWR